ncbi:MAG: hypothetical protein AAFY38_03350 [Pseudomonadota bacterium]
MTHVLPPVAVFLATLIAAAGLSIRIAPWQATMSQRAGEILGAATGADGFDAEAVLSAVGDPAYAALQRWARAAEAGVFVGKPRSRAPGFDQRQLWGRSLRGVKAACVAARTV